MREVGGGRGRLHNDFRILTVYRGVVSAAHFLVLLLTLAHCSSCVAEHREVGSGRKIAAEHSGNGVVVPHEAPDGPPKPKKKGKK